MTERREWLIRCEFEGDELAVCAIEAANGRVGVSCPDHTSFYLTVAQSREFADALRDATAQAERDWAERPSLTPGP